MINSRLSITGGRVVKRATPSGTFSLQASKAAPQAIKGSMLGDPAVGGGAMSTIGFGGPTHNTTFLGILPDYNENFLTTYYRDCYYYDSIAGSTVDIIANFPFSDYTLTGIENNDIPVFSESLSRVNIRALLQEISTNYMVDGAFIGSLVYNKADKVFQDVMVHDTMNSTISQNPLYAVDPVVSVNSANSLNEFLNAGSPYVEQMMRSYPQGMLDTFRSGTVILDPLTTLFMQRRGLRDRTHASYLKRLLPVYMLEKLLYRGTLVEATKRLRSTSHIMAGDDTWEPNNAELGAILADFQRSELDPLGAWIITRNGVQINEVRPGGDFWKWSDNIDTFTPFKLRALGISEAFMSGDASYATAEAAISVFMDNMDAFRQNVTYRIFTSKIFPLVAVLNGLYKNPKEARQIRGPQDLMYNLGNVKNLKIPEIRWHKSLEGENKESEFDMLEKLSDKGFVVPLKMWASAAGVDISMMMADLKEDQEIKRQIQEVTGLQVKDQGDQAGDDAGNADPEAMEFSARRPGTVPFGAMPRRAQNLLARQFETKDGQTSKSGNILHAGLGDSAGARKMNDLIIKASRALSDPEHRLRIRKKVLEKLGAAANLGL
jgi:hypothetical protein